MKKSKKKYLTNPRKTDTIGISISYRSVPGKRRPEFVRSADLQSPPHKWHGFRILTHNPEVSGSNPLPATKSEPESCPQGDATRGSGFSFPKGTQSRAWRTAVDFSSHGDALRNGGISYTSVHLRCEPQLAGFVKTQSITYLSKSHRSIS
jgi:hypothetical protein